MENNRQEIDLNFLNEQGELLPLDILQKQLEEIYNQIKENACNESSVLEHFVNQECQINADEVLETFSFLNRSLYLCTEITHEHAIAFSDAIKFWNEMDNLDNISIEERDPIKIYIDSPGGDLDATFSIIDSITLSKTPITTITIGSGDSGGFFIGIVGHKRIGYPHSSYLFHEGCCANEGDAHKYIQFTEFYKKKLSMLKKLVLNNTKLSENDYEESRKDDLWLTADEALKYGIIDEIATELI